MIHYLIFEVCYPFQYQEKGPALAVEGRWVHGMAGTYMLPKKHKERTSCL